MENALIELNSLKDKDTRLTYCMQLFERPEPLTQLFEQWKKNKQVPSDDYRKLLRYFHVDIYINLLSEEQTVKLRYLFQAVMSQKEMIEQSLKVETAISQTTHLNTATFFQFNTKQTRFDQLKEAENKLFNAAKIYHQFLPFDARETLSHLYSEVLAYIVHRGAEEQPEWLLKTLTTLNLHCAALSKISPEIARMLEKKFDSAGEEKPSQFLNATVGEKLQAQENKAQAEKREKIVHAASAVTGLATTTLFAALGPPGWIAFTVAMSAEVAKHSCTHFLKQSKIKDHQNHIEQCSTFLLQDIHRFFDYLQKWTEYRNKNLVALKSIQQFKFVLIDTMQKCVTDLKKTPAPSKKSAYYIQQFTQKITQYQNEAETRQSTQQKYLEKLKSRGIRADKIGLIEGLMKNEKNMNLITYPEPQPKLELKPQPKSNITPKHIPQNSRDRTNVQLHCMFLEGGYFKNDNENALSIRDALTLSQEDYQAKWRRP